jgi:hypothetical protein
VRMLLLSGRFLVAASHLPVVICFVTCVRKGYL